MLLDKATVTSKKLPVAVFAHNEERYIVDCLDSLKNDKLYSSLEIFVIANGCTDRTEDIVREYSKTASNIHLISVPIGDKANAWNVFVHEIAQQAELYFFIDGDCVMRPNALSHLAETLNTHPDSYITTALPANGRNKESLRKNCIDYHGVMGNLYAANNRFINEIRWLKIRLPIGFVREDGLVGAIAKYDFAPEKDRWDHSKVAIAEEAEFLMHSLDARSYSGLKVYIKRLMRYSVGHYQNIMIGALMQKEGVNSIPDNVRDLYLQSEIPRLKWRGLYTIFDWLSIRAIKKYKV